MALTDTAPDTDAPITDVDVVAAEATERSGLEVVLGSGDHVIVGRVFVVGSLALLCLNLVAAALIALSNTATDLLPEALINRLVPNHLLGLAFAGVVPLFLGIAIVVVPRQVGAGSLAFPRAAAAAAWSWVISSGIWVVAVIGNGSYGGSNRELARMGNVAMGAMMVSLIVAAVCVATTVFTCRPMGMSLKDVPFFSFSMLIASTVWILSLPAAVANIALGQITHATPNTLFFRTFGEGLSWLAQQPAIYALCIPVLGFALDAVTHLTRGTSRFRGINLTLIAMFGLLSFGAWAQTATQRTTAIWVLSSLLIIVPVLALFGGLGDTARTGRFTLASPLGFAVMSLLLLLIGTLMGGLLAINSAGHGDLMSIDVPSVGLAQFYVVVGAAVVGALGSIFYWGPLVFGDQLPESAGRGIGPLALVGAVLWGGALFIIGLATPTNDAVRAFMGVSFAGALILLIAVVGAAGAGLAALATSRRGDELLPDPWGGGGTLEWAPPASYDEVSGPYPLLIEEEASA